MGKQYVSFAGGVSTEPEVNELLDKLGIPKPGDEIPYSKVEAVIGVSRGQNRWQSVTNRWRKKLERDHNLILKAIANQGYRVLTNSERVMHSSKQFDGGVKRVTKAIVVAQKTDRIDLSEEEKRTLDHVTDTGFKIRQSAIQGALKLKALEEQKAALEAGTNGSGKKE